jgi:hypothetical protein
MTVNPNVSAYTMSALLPPITAQATPEPIVPATLTNTRPPANRGAIAESMNYTPCHIRSVIVLI